MPVAIIRLAKSTVVKRFAQDGFVKAMYLGQSKFLFQQLTSYRVMCDVQAQGF